MCCCVTSTLSVPTLPTSGTTKFTDHNPNGQGVPERGLRTLMLPSTRRNETYAPKSKTLYWRFFKEGFVIVLSSPKGPNAACHDTLLCLHLSFPQCLFASAAVPTHWHHRPTVRPVCQYGGVKEREPRTSTSQGERKQDEGGRRSTFIRSPAHWDFEGTACWRSSWKTLNLHIFKSQDYLPLDVCRIPEHAYNNPTDIYPIFFFSFCML